ncbi:MAG TPA: hypothetical protein VMJ73_10520 [Rhizomicrobium sp.]|nr:hypothetical protein [Rhizomicrobium sp.]
MRPVLSGCAFAVCMLLSEPAVACAPVALHGLEQSYAAQSNGGGDVTRVSRGQEMAIECDGIAKPGADVSVVMSLDPMKGVSPTGYEAVLLTDQRVGGKAVHFRVPDTPDLAQHTVTLRVYVTDSKGTTECEAGHLRIV